MCFFFFPFQTSEILAALAAVIEGYNAEEKAAQLKKVGTGSIAPHSCVFTPLPELLFALPGIIIIIIINAQNNGVFEFRVKNAAGKEAYWTIDLKKTGVVKKGEAKSSLGLKPDVTIILSDETFVDIADGKTTGQKAFMTGALKTKGNMMLATKLDGVLKVCQLSICLVFMLAYTELRMLSEHEGQGEALNCGVLCRVSATYLF